MKRMDGKFISSAAAAAACMLLGAALPSLAAMDLRIIHMNDIHSHLTTESGSLIFNGISTKVQLGGMPRAVTKISQLAAEQPNHLILNAGDTFQGTLFYSLFKGDATAAMMNQVAWDAIELGNHEFDDGDAHLAAYLDKLNAPILGANVVPAAGNVLEGKWNPYIIKEVAGQRIGIIGIDIKQKTEASSSPSDEITFLDEIITAQQYADHLRTAEGVDKIILLSHYGLENDINLARQVRGIDVIIGGDSHSLLGDLSALGLSSAHPYPLQVSSASNEPVCIAQAWEYAKMVGSLDVRFDDAGLVTDCGGASVLLLGDSFQQNNTEVDAATRTAIEGVINSLDNAEIVAEDPAALSALKVYQDQVDALKDQVIGQAAEELNHVRVPGSDYLGNSGADFPLGSEIAPLVAKGFYDLSLRADACIQNAGGVRINVPAGDITIGTAYTLLPFSNTLYEIDMKGSEIKQVLEDALANYLDNGGSNGSFPYAYGLKYDINAGMPRGLRIANLEIKDRQSGSWSAIDPDALYVIVTNSFTAMGQDGYTTFKTVQDERGPGVDTYLDYAMSFVEYAETLAVQGKQMEPLPAGDHCIKSYETESLIRLAPLATYKTGVFDEGAAEIVAHDPKTQQLFVVNGHDEAIDIIDISSPGVMVKKGSIDISPYGASPNSVAVKNGLVAVAVEADPKQDPGSVVFFRLDGRFLGKKTVGALPDMLTFTPDGSKVLVANEGEPNDDYSVDPEGSVSIIDISRGVKKARVTTASFRGFNRLAGLLRKNTVRIFGPEASVAQDLEPEYITVSADSKTAWITLQENNGLAELDLRSKRITKILPFGYKNHGGAGKGLDTSDKDGAIRITPWSNLYGMYQPDGLASFVVDGRNYILSANEGDARDYDGFSEEKRVKNLTLDPQAFPDAKTVQADTNLGRLTVTTTLGDKNGDGSYEGLYSFGTRSFSIWSQCGRQLKQVYDSGDLLEQVTAATYPEAFNSESEENGSLDKRSDNKGPEPEGVAHGIIRGRHFAFVGLERIGGIMVFDVSNPEQPAFVQYINNRDFTGDAEAGTAGDLAPEGLTFIPALDSPNGEPMLAVANEVSGSTTLYAIDMANLPELAPGDLNNDGTVNARDLLVLKTYLGQSASVFSECDLDEDGLITEKDVKKLARMLKPNAKACLRPNAGGQHPEL